MNKSRVIILLLVVLLIGSNAWWAYRVLDLGVTATYREVSFNDHRTALLQTLALLPVVAQSNATKDAIIAAAKPTSEPAEPFEKDGYVWVGRIGLKFNGENRLVEVVPSWDPFR